MPMQLPSLHNLRFVEELSEHAAIALEKAQLLRSNLERQQELERKAQQLSAELDQLERDGVLRLPAEVLLIAAAAVAGKFVDIRKWAHT